MKNILQIEDKIFIVNDITVSQLMQINNGSTLQVLPFIIHNWSLEEELNLKNILRLKKEIIEQIINKSKEKHQIIKRIGEAKLEGVIRNFFLIGKIHLVGFEEEEKKVLSEAFLYSNMAFDHRANLIHLPEPNKSVADQPAYIMYFLNIYRRELNEKIDKENKKGGLK